MLKALSRKICRAVVLTVGDYFAPYYVRCDFGTWQPCWSLEAATAWLPFCGPSAIITARYQDDSIIVRRIQTNA